MLKRIAFYLGLSIVLITTLSWISVVGDSLNPPVNELDEIKKLIPPNVILYHVTPEETADIDPIQALLVKYKIGNTLSKTLQNDYYTVMRKTLGTDICGNTNLFMSQCARGIKGYYLSVQIAVTGCTVTVEYALFDPNKNVMLCSNLLQKDYTWTIKRFSKTNMVDNSLDESVQDMYNQLKMERSELVGL